MFFTFSFLMSTTPSLTISQKMKKTKTTNESTLRYISSLETAPRTLVCSCSSAFVCCSPSPRHPLVKQEGKGGGSVEVGGDRGAEE